MQFQNRLILSDFHILSYALVLDPDIGLDMALNDADNLKYHKAGCQILLKVHGKFFDMTQKCQWIVPE